MRWLLLGLTLIMFYFHSRTSECLLLFDPNNVVGIICEKYEIICSVCISNIFSGISSALCLFFSVKLFSFIWSIEVGRVWTNKSKYGSESDSMKKVEKQNNPNLMNLFWCKVNVNRFGFNNLFQDFDIMRIVHREMDACRDNRSK